MEISLAILLGTLFGFALHRVGASNPENIINMLRLTDLHLMKAILFAVGLSGALLFLGMTYGLIDPGNLDVKSSYNGVIIGGLLLGSGFALAGYCPGTGLAALGDGRKDAIFFVAGGLIGALSYMLVYGNIAHGWLFNSIAGGKVTLAATGNGEFSALLSEYPGLWVAIVISLVYVLIAWTLPSTDTTRKGAE